MNHMTNFQMPLHWRTWVVVVAHKDIAIRTFELQYWADSCSDCLTIPQHPALVSSGPIRGLDCRWNCFLWDSRNCHIVRSWVILFPFINRRIWHAWTGEMEHTSLSVLCSMLISLLLLWQKSVHTFLNCAGKYKSVRCFYTQRQYLCPSHTITQRVVDKHLTKQW